MHNNWSVVDLLFREFYTGSDRDLAADERAALEKARKGRKLEPEREGERVSDPLSVREGLPYCDIHIKVTLHVGCRILLEYSRNSTCSFECKI